MQILNQEILLLGIVGSRAYGLAGAESDTDRLGIFVAPTSAFHGLRSPRDTHTQHAPNPDITIHEAAKWCRLAMACNPTIIELVWLPAQLIELESTWGTELRNIRTCFPTANGVRNAYLGYATQQFKRLAQRGDTFSADTAKRTAKHARHLMRLCWQGLTFYQTGKLPIHIDEPEKFHAFGQSVARGDVQTAKSLLSSYEDQFNRSRSPLSDRPDEARIEQWLRAVRHAYWREEDNVEEVQRRSAALHAELLTRGSNTRREHHHRWDIPHSG